MHRLAFSSIIMICMAFVNWAQVQEAKIAMVGGRDTLVQVSLDFDGVAIADGYSVYKDTIQARAPKWVDTLVFHVTGLSRIIGVTSTSSDMQIREISISRNAYPIVSSNGFPLKDSSNWRGGPYQEILHFCDSTIVLDGYSYVFLAWRLEQPLLIIPGDSVFITARWKNTTLEIGSVSPGRRCRDNITVNGLYKSNGELREKLWFDLFGRKIVMPERRRRTAAKIILPQQ